MSDTFTASDFYGESVATDDAAPDVEETGGQGEVTDDTAVTETTEVVAETAEPEANYFDPSQFAGHKARVKVDGEEIEVPVEELVQGYQRQADYTRKTQELAQQREQIAFWRQVDEAMKVNPELTMEYLQQYYGINAAQAAAEDDWGVNDLQVDDPIAQRLAAIEQAVQPALQLAQRQQAEQYLNQVVTGLTQKYGDDFNPTEVIAEAVNRGVHDPGALESIYTEMALARYRAAAQAQAAVQAQNAQRSAAAQQASTLVSTGASASGGAAAANPPRQARTVWEAFEMAKAELGAA